MKSTVIPLNIFASSSPFYRELPAADADRPVATNSAALIADFCNQMKTYYSDGTHYNMGLQANTPGASNQYSQTLRVVTSADPWTAIENRGSTLSGYSPPWMCTDGVWSGSTCANPVHPNASGMAQFHVPVDLEIPDGTDHSVALWNSDTHEYLEMWGARRETDGHISCRWGGYIADSTQWDGRFDFPSTDSRHSSGTCAVGAAMAAWVQRWDELLAGEIMHPVSFGLVNVYNRLDSSGNYLGCYPGTRHDGNTSSADVLCEGQYVYFPASINFDTDYYLHPLALTLCKALQKRGGFAVDKGGACGINAVNPAQSQLWKMGGLNVYDLACNPTNADTTPNSGFNSAYNFWSSTIISGRSKDPGGTRTYDAIPFDQLVAAPLDWHVPVESNITDLPGTLATKTLPKMTRALRGEIDNNRGLTAKSQNTANTGRLEAAANRSMVMSLTATGQTLLNEQFAAVSAWTSGGSSATVALDTTTYNSSPSSMGITLTANASGSASYVTNTATKVINGTSVSFAWYHDMPTTCTLGMVPVWYDANGTATTGTATTFTGTAAWAQATATATAPSTAVSVAVRFYGTGVNAAGAVNIDDVTITGSAMSSGGSSTTVASTNFSTLVTN